MMQKFLHSISKEALFQVILIGILYVSVVFNKKNPEINLSDSLFFFNYVLAALAIGYILLPRFFYKKEYRYFALGVIAILIVVVIIEEFVLEKIFYPDSRGSFFPGVLPTLFEVLPIILILVGFKFGWDAQRKQSELEKLNTIVAESRLQFLKSQINPHFLFNNLNNLYSLSLENSPKTSGIILELSSLLRYMLYDSQEDFVAVDKEIKCLDDFVRLQTLQIGDRGNIEFSVTGKAGSQVIAPLLLIVFAENCFKHSTSSLSDGIFIQIDLNIMDGKLIMQCNNTFSPNTNTEKLSKGIGLENVKSRLELLYPDAHILKISSDENVFQVYLELRLKEIQ
ncbi:MAG: histidine kinase [Bacteroidia bacterium]|nr:histidine kinase [Bacteroidia bacterium]